MPRTGLPPAARFAERLIEAVEARDVARICALHHPDIELQSVLSRDVVIRGRAEARRMTERLVDDLMLGVSLGKAEAIADDLVLVQVQVRSSTPGGGHRFDSHWLLWQLKDGVLWRQYTGSQDDLRARAASVAV